MAKIYLKWQKWDNIVSDLFLIIKKKISKIFNFKDKIVYQITFRKKKQSALGDWTQLAWAQVHYSNHYATGTNASGLWSVQNLENVWILKQISYWKSSFQTIHDWFFLSDNFTLKFYYQQIKMQISYTPLFVSSIQ